MKTQFDRDGFVVMRGLLKEEANKFKHLQSRCEQLFTGKFPTGVYPDEWHWREGMSFPKQTKEICNAWKSDLEIAAMVMKPRLGETVCELMDWPSVRIAQDDVILKPPGGGTAVGLHQDSTYISANFQLPRGNANECLSVTMWIPLECVDAENGSLTYLKGSHKTKKKIVSSDGAGAFHTTITMSGNNLNSNTDLLVTMEMTPGDVVIHHESTWHFSSPNHSPTRTRNVLVIHFLRGDVQFVQRPTYIYARYKLYRSVELREEFFPTVFPPSQFCIDYLAGNLSSKL